MMSTPELSVVLCTHNPRADYLRRTLDSIAAQTLDRALWEFVVIDNASSPALDADGPPQRRVVREETPGLVHARLRGIRETTGALLVFVDDDNVLAPDYLARALAVSRDWPQLGTWGGQTIAEFEVEPREELRPYLWLAIREFAHDRWTNVPFTPDAMPYGAGLCARRAVAERYAQLLRDDPVRTKFGRNGNHLAGSEDTDLVLTGYDSGFGSGVFAGLKLTHLIDKCRLDEDYLLRLVEATTYSITLLRCLRGMPPPGPSRVQRLLRWYEFLHVSALTRRFEQARMRGERSAVADAKALRP
ncbi:MAG: glycosyltransferase [Chthoniobacteraceae bacterium]